MQEILLTRIFSLTIGYHLAYLAIGTALLGFGAAGSLVTAFPALASRAPGPVRRGRRANLLLRCYYGDSALNSRVINEVTGEILG